MAKTLNDACEWGAVEKPSHFEDAVTLIIYQQTEMLQDVIRKHYRTVSEKTPVSKDEMIEMLKLLHFKGQAESTTQQDEAKEDLFGNEIETPCRGNDGEIYDLKSLEYLFEMNEVGEYRRINYIYQNGIRIPNFPIMSNGVRLSSYTLLKK